MSDQGAPPTGADDVPEFLRALWRGEQIRPGPRRTVGLRELGAAGVAVADEQGLAAVSMRSVATRLGLTPMALYRYVASKDELVQVMLDEAYGRAPRLTADGWRERLADWARELRSALLAHPWILDVPIVDLPLTPHQIDWLEQALTAVRSAPVAGAVRASLVLLVDVYVRGQTQLTVGVAASMTPNGAENPDQRYARRLRALADPAAYPQVLAVFDGSVVGNPPGDGDSTGSDNTDGADTNGGEAVAVGEDPEFEFGLQTVLDGIALRLGDQGSGRTRGR